MGRYEEVQWEFQVRGGVSSFPGREITLGFSQAAGIPKPDDVRCQVTLEFLLCCILQRLPKNIILSVDYFQAIIIIKHDYKHYLVAKCYIKRKS